MNDLSAEIGLLKRQARDAQSVMGNVQHLVRKLVDGRASTFDRPAGLCVRNAVCAWLGHLNRAGPDAVQREHYAHDRELGRMLALRSAVSPAMTTVATWAAELVQTIAKDVVTNFIPQSVFAALRAQGVQYEFVDGLIRAPTWAPVQTGAFISEGSPIPVSKFTLGSMSLTPKKAASITALSNELAMGAAFDVERTLQIILGESVGLTIDAVLLGSGAATAAAPAGLLNGVSPLTASAATPAASAMIADVKALIAAIAPSLRPVLIAGPVTAASLSLLAPTTSSLAVIVSAAVPTGSLICVDAAAFASALGIPSFRASQHASLHEEDTTPLPLGTGTQGSGVVAVPMRGLFSTDTSAMRSITPVDWTLRRTGAVAYVSAVTW